jgi:hypothetical protein
LTGDLLTATSERTVKKLALKEHTHTTEVSQIMPTNTQESAMMICYREYLSNLEKFSGDEDQKAIQFINNIERIGKMIEANDDILYCTTTAKLEDETKRWYEINTSLTHWETLKSALLERFTTSDSSSKVFEQLKERKQKSDETVTSYYDAIIKLCLEYDPAMSQKMMISWLENGIKAPLKIQIKRQMTLLPESARTAQSFLKIAKDEQELQEENTPETEPTPSYIPYFANTVSTTVQQTENRLRNMPQHSQLVPANALRQQENPYQQRTTFEEPQRLSSRNYRSPPLQRSFTYQSKPFTYRQNMQRTHSQTHVKK